jgi:hypothetical protein
MVSRVRVQFLADEICDLAVVRALHSAGNVFSPRASFRRRSVDRTLAELAYAAAFDISTLIAITPRPDFLRLRETGGGFSLPLGAILYA